MAELGSTQPIIIKKKGGDHGGHHGGAWKVAYADFVTAMMALFIVLWLMNTNEETKKAISGYFKDPTGKTEKVGNGQTGIGEGLSIGRQDMLGLKDQIEAAMKAMPELNKLKDQVAMTVTGEGLRIELLETEKGTFFERGKPDPSQAGREMLEMLSKELGAMPNLLLIEGHTDAKPYTGRASYSNWELSVDRANAARRLMLGHGIRDDQVKQVRGFADQHLRKPDAPDDASNRRISVLVQYMEAADEPVVAEKKSEKEAGEAPSGGHGAAPAEHK